MNDILRFNNRAEFRNWLYANCLSNDGFWLIFDKSKKPTSITATEALEEALCFGWLDGQMQSIDDKTYKKYFSMRRANSKWSDKNKALVQNLEERGLMTDFGRKKIEEAKQNGQGNARNLWRLRKSKSFVCAIYSKNTSRHLRIFRRCRYRLRKHIQRRI